LQEELMATKEASSEALAAAEAKARSKESAAMREIERLREQLRSSEAAALVAAEAAAQTRLSAPAVMQDRAALRLSPRLSTEATSVRQSPAASPPASGRLSEVGRVPASVKSMGTDSEQAGEVPEWVKCIGDESRRASSLATGEELQQQQQQEDQPVLLSGSQAKEAFVKDAPLDNVLGAVSRDNSEYAKSVEDPNLMPGIDDDNADTLDTPTSLPPHQHERQRQQQQQQQQHQHQYVKPDLLATGGGFTDDESDSLENEKHTAQGTSDKSLGGHEAAEGNSSADSDSVMKRADSARASLGRDEDDGFGDDSLEEVSGDDLDSLLH